MALPDIEENNMEREEIYQQLTNLIPESKRRAPSHRVCEELGMNALLDQLLTIQIEEMERHYESD
jgi:hypothetical protein